LGGMMAALVEKFRGLAPNQDHKQQKKSGRAPELRPVSCVFLHGCRWMEAVIGGLRSEGFGSKKRASIASNSPSGKTPKKIYHFQDSSGHNTSALMDG
jgi:hypothetical protein